MKDEYSSAAVDSDTGRVAKDLPVREYGPAVYNAT